MPSVRLWVRVDPETADCLERRAAADSVSLQTLLEAILRRETTGQPVEYRERKRGLGSAQEGTAARVARMRRRG